MLQVLQDLRHGTTNLAQVPCPSAGPAQVLVRSSVSLISAGTERMLLGFGKASWIEKARSQPDKVRALVDKARTDGIAATIASVRAKLDQPVALGYANAGRVVEAGADSGFLPGERVASNGNHAEVVRVSKNLCARIPDSVSDDAAAFTVLGGIALEGIRLVQPALGEYVVVTGLGLVGLLTVQLLRASGCRVLGLDFDAARVRLADQFGAETVNLSADEDPVRAAERFSHGRGVDAVLITAATKSNEPVHQAALMCRKRGRIVLVGVAGLELSREDFYKKELSFQVSCSYGPGRYDTAFERDGIDYPYPYVRWTAQRNFEAVLDMLATARLDVAPLITHRFPFARAEEAYRVIESNEPHLGVLLEYPAESEKPDRDLRARSIAVAPSARTHGTGRIAFIGAGAYATKVLLPAFKAAGVELNTIASETGISSAIAARKFGFAKATTEAASVFADPEIDTVVIATRHDSHARYVVEAIRAGKNVLVEKPLALTAGEIDSIENAYADALREGRARCMMVGFNRRFAPQVVKMKALLVSARDPKAVVITINAAAVASDHWTTDPKRGGDRIRGEACHFIDLLRFLIGSRSVSVQGSRLTGTGDSITFSISFEDGSTGTVHYFTSGHKRFPKERVEVFCAGRVLQLDNFRRLRAWGWSNFRGMNLWRQDKGANAMVGVFVDCVRNARPAAIPFDELLEVSRRTIEVANL